MGIGTSRLAELSLRRLLASKIGSEEAGLAYDAASCDGFGGIVLRVRRRHLAGSTEACGGTSISTPFAMTVHAVPAEDGGRARAQAHLYSLVVVRFLSVLIMRLTLSPFMAFIFASGRRASERLSGCREKMKEARVSRVRRWRGGPTGGIKKAGRSGF